MKKLQLGFLLAVVLVAAGALWWQRHPGQPAAIDRAAPAAEQPSTAVTAAAPTGRAAAATKSEPTSDTPHDLPLRAVASSAGRTPPAAAALAAGMAPVDSLGNQGRASPQATFATQLWAARMGDIDTEASVIALTPAGRATLERLLASLPAQFTSQYNTPEKLMAFALAGSPHPVGGMEILGSTDEGPNDVVLDTRWQHVDDTIVHESPVRLHRDTDGWKMIVPTILVDRAAAYLTNHRPTSARGQ